MRLNGIDAPEHGQLCQNQAGKPYNCGQSALVALNGQVRGGEVRCGGTKHDRYQGLIATCWKGDEDLNQWMVLNGWAVAYRTFSTVYVDAEDTARMAKRGLWSGDFETPWEWWVAH